ncbi:ASG_G0011570.mRNA.1.CDS.1 [Saccharomyces cerevisiae]|nr:Atp5p [Saccharomyces cerevisiae YJM693]AJU93047.1 Atp5p [Saccharomyces cerevisiae YJM1332]AJU99386.1 Atp5p [Saccharomyces cerevisiae YJM1385]AJV05730.1 Atp5p [Saccharomyces cerevisiae YJM1415]CAI4353539.1 ASG_G0011570.mRNA.1.CDS.1 [Saccharomyces cerevisiae]
MFNRVFTRSFASSLRAAASKAAAPPPVRLFGVEGTYATALYQAAAKNSSIDAAFQSLQKVESTVKKNPKLGHLLLNPALSLKDRNSVIDAIVETHKNLDGYVVNLLKVLSENNRLGCFEKIASDFGVLNDAHNGLLEGTVTSAEPLDPKSFKRIEKALSASKLVGQGKSLKLENVVKPEIKGGLIVELGDKTVDLSISTKIQKLNKVLEDSI